MFWRREGGPLDFKTNSPMAWLQRIIAVVVVAAVIAVMFRLAAPQASAEVAAASDELPDPLKAGWQDEQVCALLQETDDVRALRCTFAPGVGHERHFHAPHFGYILEGGTMQITDVSGTREQETPAGATWVSDGVDWHEALNIGDTTTVYIIVEPKGAPGE
ncbi:cupin domain-containing protein [Hyphococcus sp.]|uniref:cupin domain-containing protein n=1 Tax=Hyphococcus sp. TaxID=2038636 RepID=UPI003CCC2EF9